MPNLGNVLHRPGTDQKHSSLRHRYFECNKYVASDASILVNRDKEHLLARDTKGYGPS